MRNKLTFTFILLMLLSKNMQAQICECPKPNCICKDFRILCDSDLIIKERTCKEIFNELDSIKKQHPKDSSKKVSKLITNYTFRKKFRNDFAKILIDENTFSSLNVHASLKVDENKSKVSFSPFVFHNRNLDFRPFTYFGSIELAATVDDDQIFKVFDKDGVNRDFNVNINFNWIPNHIKLFRRRFPLNWSSYRKNICFDKYIKLVECARIKVCEDYDEKINSLKDSCNKIDDWVGLLDELCDTAALRKGIWNKFSEMEDKLSSGFWTWNNKAWVSFSLSPYAYKEYNALDTLNKTLIDKSRARVSAKVVLNMLHNNVRNDKAIYFNLWSELAWKNSFTEQSTTKWNQYKNISDSTINILKTKDIYVYDSVNYAEKYLPNLGAQFIAITDFCWHHFDIKFPIGIDITYRVNFLPALTKTENDYQKHIITEGLVFPFNDKDGKRTINIEVFHSNTIFSTDKLPDENFWGVKFSVPIFSKD